MRSPTGFLACSAAMGLALSVFAGWAAVPAEPAKTTSATGATPVLSAASIMCLPDEPFLLFGEELDDPSLQISGAAFETAADWNPAASLQRVLTQGAALPPTPPDGTAVTTVYAADTRTAAVKPIASAKLKSALKAVWAKTKSGCSAPLAVNTPVVYTTRPVRPFPGDQVRCWGVNFGARFSACLVGEDNRVIACETGRSYSHEKGYSPAFEGTFIVPRDLSPARYRLFVHFGGGDYGWSQPFDMEVTVPPPPARVFVCEIAPADGELDAAPAIQEAIRQAAAAGGGVVTLKPGVFLVKKTVVVEPGVTLRGAGRNATTLVSPARDQIPVVFHHYRSIVHLKPQTALEHVTVDASPGTEHHGVLLRDTTAAALRGCEVRNLTPVLRPGGQWVPADQVVTVSGKTFGLIIEDCTLRGGTPFSFWGGVLVEATVRHNLFEGLPTSSCAVGIAGALRRGVFEHNRIERGGRALTIQGEAVHTYFGFNLIENIRGIGNGCEMLLYEMGHSPWQGVPQQVTADGFVTPDMQWDAKSLNSSAGGYPYTTYAVVTAGRGLGQAIPVQAFDGQTVKLARPWTLQPDPSTHVVLARGCLENLHVENQFKEGVAYSGIFGSGVRNIWAGDEFERVSDGMVLWALGRTHPICLNVLRNLRLQDRAGILLIASIESKDPIQAPIMLGNEIRACQVYHRKRYPGNEYGLNNRVWRYPFNETPPGNARHVTFGDEAGIHLSAFFDWPGNHHDQDAKLPSAPPAGSWNLVWDSLVARSPVGLRISKSFDRTAVIDLTSAINETAVSDSGTQTLMQAMSERPATSRSERPQ